jgi:hypothetical protein
MRSVTRIRTSDLLIVIGKAEQMQHLIGGQ